MALSTVVLWFGQWQHLTVRSSCVECPVADGRSLNCLSLHCLLHNCLQESLWSCPHACNICLPTTHDLSSTWTLPLSNFHPKAQFIINNFSVHAKPIILAINIVSRDDKKTLLHDNHVQWGTLSAVLYFRGHPHDDTLTCATSKCQVLKMKHKICMNDKSCQQVLYTSSKGFLFLVEWAVRLILETTGLGFKM